MSRFRVPSRRRLIQEPQMSVIVRTVVRLLLPVVLVFGAYIILYGHLTPGGGFQGGMILVGAAMSFYVAYGYNIVRRFHEETLHRVESVGALIYLGLGLVGLFAVGAFLLNFLPKGEPNRLLSAGFLPILNIVVGFKVAAGTLVVLLALLEALKKGE